MGRARAHRTPLSGALVGLAIAALAGCDDLWTFRDTGIRLPDVPECFSNGDCEDSIACTVEECHDDRCVQRRPPGLCEGYCIAGVGCRLAGMPCDDPSDCADRDGCTIDEACLGGFCTFTYLGDRDGDGDLPLACGGGDCDDEDPERFAYARDLCNEIDDDCDGDVDEEACGEHGACIDRRCVCEEGYTECDGTCVNLRRDGDHCGECGNRCSDISSCERGVCECPGLLVECSGVCRLRADTGCGPCGLTCPPGSSCENGSCVCADGLLSCGRACVDPETSIDHCGACGERCDWRCETCVGGRCEITVEGYQSCRGACVDVRTDVFDCGACGRTCDLGGRENVCVDGECGCSGALCGETCADLLYDSSNCGRCGHACRSSWCSLGTCAPYDCGDGPVDLDWDSDHCGDCRRACSADQSCAEGVCVAGPRCARRRTICEWTDGELEPGPGYCVAREDEWCSRGGDVLGVLRLTDVSAGAADAVLAAAALGDRVCIGGARSEPFALSASVSCTDRDGLARHHVHGRSDSVVEGIALGTSGTLTTALTIVEPALGTHGAIDRSGYTIRVDATDGARAAAVADTGASAAIAGSFAGDLRGACYDGGVPCSGGAPRRAIDRDAYVVTDAVMAEASPIATLGGAGDDGADAIASSGDELIVAGRFASTLGTGGIVTRGGSDAFVARVQRDGSIAWARGIGGAGEDRALAVIADAARAYVAIAFEGTIDAGGGARTTPRGRGILVTAIEAATGAHAWSRALDLDAWADPIATATAASRIVEPAPRLGLAAAPDGSIVVAGGFEGTRAIGAGSLTSAGGVDAAVVVLAPDDGAASAARAIGGPLDDHAGAVAVDGAGGVWVAALVRGPLVIGGSTIATEGGGDVALIGIIHP